MIKWDQINGVLGSYHTNDWIGDPNDDTRESWIKLTYTTDLENTRVYILDGSLPTGIVSYADAQNHCIYIHGQIKNTSLYKTNKFVIRAESHDQTVIDDIYCAIIVNNMVNKDGEELSWKTKASDFPTDVTSFDQISFKFELNNDCGNQYFYKIYGELPLGLSLDNDGNLLGIVEQVEETVRCEFTLACEVSGYIEDEYQTITLTSDTFSVNVNPITEAMINPIFLNNNIFLANVDYNSDPITINVKAWIKPARTIMYRITQGSLPSGLKLGLYTGIIQGVCTEVNEREFTFTITASCSDTGGSTDKVYKISTNSQTYKKDIITPDPISQMSLGTFKIGEYIYKEIIVENKTMFYTFDTRKIHPVLPKGLTLAYDRRYLGEAKWQTVLIISGVIEPQEEKTVDLELIWFKDNTEKSATFQITVVVGEESDITRLYIGLSREFLSDWSEQFKFFAELSEVDSKEVDSEGHNVPIDQFNKILNNIVTETTLYNGNTEYIKRQFDRLVVNHNNYIYGIKYLPKIYLNRKFKLSSEDLNIEDTLGTYDLPLSFSLSNIKYQRYPENENEEAKYYVIYRDVIDHGFGEISKKVYNVDESGKETDIEKVIVYNSPTFSILKEKLNSINKYSTKNEINGVITYEDNNLLEWETSWSPKLVLMYVRPDALSIVLPLINQLNEKFVSKIYKSQYINSESYFTNIVPDDLFWYFVYYQKIPSSDWRQQNYNGNTPIQPLLNYPDLPSVTNYALITEKRTPNMSKYEIIVDDNTLETVLEISQTVGHTLYNIEIDKKIFEKKCELGEYIFTFVSDESGDESFVPRRKGLDTNGHWRLNNKIVDLNEYGITFGGISRIGNELTVRYYTIPVGGYNLASDIQLIIEDF